MALAAGRRPPPARTVRPPWTALALGASGVACLLAGSGAFGPVVAGYALLLSAAGLEWKRAGMILVAAGLAANLAVIAADGGMPVKGLAAGAATGPLHHGLRAGDRLTGLADVIHVPFLSQVASPGDVVLALGAAVAMFAWLQPRARRIIVRL